MQAVAVGKVTRALRIRQQLRQEDLARLARVPRRAISNAERGLTGRLSVAQLEAILGALGARLDFRVLWNGPELDRLLDAGHAALQAAVKQQLERWGWELHVEVSYSHYGERGRVDLLAYHPATGVLLVIEIKTELVDVQTLLGTMDAKVRLAPQLVGQFGWRPTLVLPAIVFAEDRTTRRRLATLDALFDRYSLRGRECFRWLRQRSVAGNGGSTAPGDGVARDGGAAANAKAASNAKAAPTGLLWLTSRASARVPRTGGQRVVPRRVRRAASDGAAGRGVCRPAGSSR